MRIRKVVAYVTRTGANGKPELLVFDHRDFPEAGTQVVAGSIDDGELPEVAAIREVEEESGVLGCRILSRLAVYDWEHPVSHNTHERHVYHLAAPAETQEEWTWIETDGGRVPEDRGIVFLFRWVPLDEEIDLAGHQGDWLHLLR